MNEGFKDDSQPLLHGEEPSQSGPCSHSISHYLLPQKDPSCSEMTHYMVTMARKTKGQQEGNELGLTVAVYVRYLYNSHRAI